MSWKSIFILLSFLFLSCNHTEELLVSQSFQVNREEVWGVLVAVLKSYPLKTIDEKKGYIETEVLNANRFWKPPHAGNKDFSGYSSVITVRLNYKKPISRVFIDKRVYKQKGFISNKKEVTSDLLEETVLLYQISRELNIRSRLSRLQ